MKATWFASALAAIWFSGGALAASYESIAAEVDATAFQDADSNWRSMMVRRNPACGAYGKNGKRRLDVLIERYETLAAALNSGNDEAVRIASKKFAATATASSRFNDCWRQIARKTNVSRSLPAKIEKAIG